MAFDKPGTPDAPATRGTSTPSGHFVAEQGQRYWSGEGTSKGKRSDIDWGQPGDFARCVAETTPHLGAKAAGYCSNEHVRATGFRPGHAPGEGGK
jgi:hypothetical protein